MEDSLLKLSLKPAVAAAALAFAAAGAHAATYTHTFTQLTTGETVDALATLAIEDTASGVQFTLTGSFDSLGSDSFLSRIEFNGPNGAVSIGEGNTFAMQPTYGEHINASYSFTWEGQFPVSNSEGSDRFVSGDSAVWTIAGDGLSANSFSGTAMIHLQGVAGFGNESSIKVLSPIPEPETYALMLAGLAAMGMVVRRRSRMQ
jgi:hypothetical protein